MNIQDGMNKIFFLPNAKTYTLSLNGVVLLEGRDFKYINNDQIELLLDSQPYNFLRCYTERSELENTIVERVVVLSEDCCAGESFK